MTSTPVAIFAHDRPHLLARTLGVLERCDRFAGRLAHVFCDAPRTEARAAGAADTVELARAWCRRVGARLVVRRENRGFRNITDGVGELCEAHGAALALEDDHVAAPGLLAFIDRAITRYAGEERVFQVAASRVGAPWDDGPDAFFLPFPMSSGWATWDRAWRHFEWAPTGVDTLLGDPAARSAFNLDGTYPAAELLERALDGRFDSYFIRWYYAMFRAGGLALCPLRSLVTNIGLGSGVHGSADVAARDERFFNGAFAPEVDQRAAAAWALPERVEVDPHVERRVRAMLKSWKRT